MNAGTNANFGYTDWRLPSVRELQGLVDSSRSNPALPVGHPFTSVQFGYYWSATSGAYSTGNARVVYMGFGGAEGYGKAEGG